MVIINSKQDIPLILLYRNIYSRAIRKLDQIVHNNTILFSLTGGAVDCKSYWCIITFIKRCCIKSKPGRMYCLKLFFIVVIFCLYNYVVLMVN